MSGWWQPPTRIWKNWFGLAVSAMIFITGWRNLNWRYRHYGKGRRTSSDRRAILQQHYPNSRFSNDAVTALLTHEWPGNVRELRNAVFRAIMLAKNAQVEITSVDLKLNRDSAPGHGKNPLNRDLDQVERQIVFDMLDRCGGNQGKAAEALGISRRTLLRKLKTYRENESETAVGTLCAEQQRYYRKQTSAPVELQHGKESMEANLLNISLGGAAVSIHKILGQGEQVTIRFKVPESEVQAELHGRIAWANKEGHHGIQFSEMPADIRSHLQRWFQAEMKKDGWREELVG